MAKENIISGPVGDSDMVFKPTSKDLGAPTKVYPASSKLGHSTPKDLIKGPCDDCSYDRRK